MSRMLAAKAQDEGKAVYIFRSGSTSSIVRRLWLGGRRSLLLGEAPCPSKREGFVDANEQVESRRRRQCR